MTTRKMEEDQKLPEEPAMATRNSGEEIRVPGGLRTARGLDPLEEAVAARELGRGENEGNEP